MFFNIILNYKPILYNIEGWKCGVTIFLNNSKLLVPIVKIYWSFLSRRTAVNIFNLVLMLVASCYASTLE